MADLIDRQAASKRLKNERNYYASYEKIGIGIDIARMIIEDVIPSAQPTHNNDSNVLDALDCVSKSKVIEHIAKQYIAHGEIIPEWLHIGDLPIVQPERKVGKWIIVTDSRGRHAECPYCGEWEYHSNQKFCGECGAKIEEEDGNQS